VTEHNSTIDIPLNNNLFATINADDYERELWCEFRDGFVFKGKICDLKWSPLKESSYRALYYARAVMHRLKRTVLLHRLVLCARQMDFVDHADRNGLNNVRTNLRFVTSRQNSANTGPRPGTSKFKGVSFVKGKNRFRATIQSCGKTSHLGDFVLEEDAARAFDAAALELHGEIAFTNF